ncbi:MAG: PP2C family protein-serine/threonine phosphatase, partial [Aggregatilineales bacterium]
MDFFRRIFGSNDKDENPETDPHTGEELAPSAPEPTPAPVNGLFDTSKELDDTPSETDSDEIMEDIIESEAGQPTAPLYIPDGATRPLPSEPTNIFQPYNGHLTFGQSSDQGMVRSNNQDAALSLFFTSDSVDEQPDFGLFIVADGMGGHHDGEKASALT